MAPDINNNNTNYLKQGYEISPETRKVNIDGTAVQRTVKKFVNPFVEFFTKTEEVNEEVQFKDYEKEINNFELKYAVTQKILNESDPNHKSKLNIVI